MKSSRDPIARILACQGLVLSLLVASPANATSDDTGILGGFNRWASGFNEVFAAGFVKPTLDGVRALPAPLPEALGNVFSNLSEPVSALSHMMTGDGGAAVRSSARFAINSTLGLLGTVDVAGPMGLPLEKKAFSQGACALGVPLRDVYLVVPVAGPSSVGIAGTAIAVMLGSTWVLAYVSIELAIASTVADLAASSAALENVAGAAGRAKDVGAQKLEFDAYLNEIGCAGSPRT